MVTEIQGGVDLLDHLFKEYLEILQRVAEARVVHNKW
jgi:hypothetical protein